MKYPEYQTYPLEYADQLGADVELIVALAENGADHVQQHVAPNGKTRLRGLSAGRPVTPWIKVRQFKFSVEQEDHFAYISPSAPRALSMPERETDEEEMPYFGHTPREDYTAGVTAYCLWWSDEQPET